MTLINILILDMTLHWMQVYFFLLPDGSSIATNVIIFKVDNSFLCMLMIEKRHLHS